MFSDVPDGGEIDSKEEVESMDDSEGSGETVDGNASSVGVNGFLVIAG